MTVSKSHFFYFWFCSGPARENEGINSSRDLTLPTSVAGTEGPLIRLSLLRETGCALVSVRLGCNMVWGGAHPGIGMLWIVSSAQQPWRTFCAEAWTMVPQSSYAQPMLWIITDSIPSLMVGLLSHLHRVLLSVGVETKLYKP